MRLITWNVNGIRSVGNKGFHDFIKQYNPDLLCLQETKAHPEQLEEVLLKPEGMRGYWSSAQRKGYSGVVTFAKQAVDAVTYGIGIERFDSEGRFVITEHEDFTLFNIYFPNGSRDLERHQFKQDFLKILNEKLQEKLVLGEKIVVVGDYNVAYLDHDVFDAKYLSDVSGFLPEERKWFTEFLGIGFVDVFRKFFPEEKESYTWWSYREGAREKNRGWRIDHICVSQNFLGRVTDVQILKQQHGSDHCPVLMEFK